MRITIEERIVKLIEYGKRLQARGDAAIKKAAHLDMMRQARKVRTA
jgi:hypothetical protein